MNKIYMKDAIDLLGLGGRNLLASLNLILQYSEYDGLPIYFDIETFAEESEMGSLPPWFDENVTDTKSRKLSTIKKQKIIHSLDFWIDRENVNAAIYSFIQKGKFYHVLDESSADLGAKVVDHNQLYLLREDMKKFKVKESPIMPIYKEKKLGSAARWQDLFICAPLTSSDKFDDVVASTKNFIKKYERLPTNHNELFKQVKEDYGVDMQEATMPSGNISKDNFRRRYSAWTGAKGSKTGS